MPKSKANKMVSVKLTKKEAEQFMVDEADSCPHCGSGKIWPTLENVHKEGVSLQEQYECSECDSEFIVMWKLIGLKDLRITKDEHDAIQELAAREGEV